MAETTSTQQISSGSDVTFVQEFDVPSPALWSPDQPALYRVYSVVHSNQSPTDDYVTPFGIRSAQFDPERGFLLNGSSLKLKGLCLHQDAGCLGVAVPDRSIERRLQILKGIGCNAIRVAHNPASPELLDACDRMGILVFAEMFDKWATGYGKEFELPGFADWWEEILVRALHRDRNHPSIILWSVGNEAGVPGEESHDQMLGRLVEVVHREDPTRPATCALIPQAEIPVEDIVASVVRSSRLMDVLSLNYQEQWYELYRQERADIAIVGAESYPYLRGVPFGFETANNWYDVVRHDWVAGQFVWVGFDYLGESAGWPSKGWPNGLIDSCGFVKARGSFHQSVWRNEPYVKMIVQVPDADVDEGVPAWRWPKSVAHWTFPDSADVVFAVETPSNCETVELIVNGRSLGEQRPSEHLNSTIVWYVRYSRGALEAVGRNKGVEVARDVLFSAGPTQTMRIRPDKLILVADRQDLCHIEVNLLDANGVLVPNDDRQIQFVVLGPARLIGLDNGDLRSSESYKGDRRTTREGKCLAIIQSTTDIGIVRVIMSSEGLQTLLLPLEVIPPPASE